MTPFDRALSCASALARHLESRGTTLTDVGDAMLVEAVSLIIADRGRAETARTLRLLSEHVEARL